MKKILILVSLTLTAANSFGQYIWGIDFDCPTNLDRISVDTLANPNCIWQIGQPAKTVFTTALSIPHVIITDKLNPVPPNDTFIFYLKHLTSPIPFHHLSLNFWYQMDGDSTDRGLIEVSPDSAHTVWINLLTQDSAYNFLWAAAKPTLAGSTVGWQTFDLTLMDNYSTMGIYSPADTILFRFTYITDSNSTSHDGWMIDDFLIKDDLMEGITEPQNDNFISVYPNPATDNLAIQKMGPGNKSTKQTIQILNYTGQMLYNNQNFIGEIIDTRLLNNGVYFLKYSDSVNFSVKKFIVNH